MVKLENINSRNIKYLEITDHNGGIETYFKSLNKWINIYHEQGSIIEINKRSFKQIDQKINLIRNNKNWYRVFKQGDYNNYFNTPIPGSMHNVFYDIKIGNLTLYYGEEDKYKVTIRQISRNYNKYKRRIIKSFK